MAWQLGAGVVDTPYIKATYGHFHETHPGRGRDRHPGGLQGCDRDQPRGHRFVDESLNYKEIGDAALAQPGVTTYQVFDNRVLAATSDEVPIYDFAGRESAGMLVRAETIEELETALACRRTRWSRPWRPTTRQSAAAQPIHWAARICPAPSAKAVPPRAAPFYAHPSGSVVLATYCGLTVDTEPAGAGRLRRTHRAALRGRRGDRRIPRRRLHHGHVDREGRHLRPARRQARRHRGEEPRVVTPVFDLTGEVALVVGAASGGLGARAARRPGATTAPRSSEPTSTGDRAPSTDVDVTDEASVAALVANVIATHGRIDVLVNAAGVMLRKAYDETSLAEFEHVVRVNLTGAGCSAARSPRRWRATGRIVNLSTVYAERVGPVPESAYYASKAGVANVTRALPPSSAAPGSR